MKLYQVDRPRKPRFYVEADDENMAHEIIKEIIPSAYKRRTYYLTQVMENTASLHYMMFDNHTLPRDLSIPGIVEQICGLPGEIQ